MIKGRNYSEIKILEITNLTTIIKYVNNLATKMIKPSNEIIESLDRVEFGLPESCRDEFKDKLKLNRVFKIGRGSYPLVYKIMGLDVTEVILNLTQCITVVQSLQDKAQINKKIDAFKEFYFTALMGALEELCYGIDYVEGRLVTLSPNQTHLRKILIAINSNASKLIPVERELLNIKDATFEQYLTSLTPEEQNILIEDTFLAKFKEHWVLELPNDKQQKIVELISDNEEWAIDKKIVLKIIKRMKMKERMEFIKLLKPELMPVEIKELTDFES